MKKLLSFLLAIGLLHNGLHAQLPEEKKKFTHADTLRGTLTPLRTCYDINYYHLDVKFDIDKSSSAVATYSNSPPRRISRNCSSTFSPT